MNKRTCILFVSGLIATVTPLADFTHLSIATQTVYAESQDGLSSELFSKQIIDAYQQYLQGNELDDKFVKQLQLHRDMLLPFLKNGIQLNNSIIHNSGGDESSYREWQFWLEVTSRVGDARVQPGLLEWLTGKRPIPDTYYLMNTLAVVLPKGQEAELEKQLEHSNAAGTFIILQILGERNKLNDTLLAQMSKIYAQKPQINGIVEYFSNRENGFTLLQRLYESNDLSKETKRHVIQSLLNRADVKWLRATAQNTSDLYSEQLIDSVLVRDHGDKQAAERLHRSGSQKGFAITLDGLTEKTLARLYPDGTLAKGIKAYQEIRGASYFYNMDDKDNWLSYQSAGKDFRQPKEAIPKWLSFIEKYPLHPAIDDAAYRLARCYQQIEQYDQALYWFDRAKQLGDRDLQYDTSGQFIFVLDVDMGAEQLAQLDSRQLPVWSVPWIEYSLAVENLREQKYSLASAQLETFIAKYDGQELFRHDQSDEANLEANLYSSDYPFWQKVKEQLALTKELAEKQTEVMKAAGQQKAKKQYELAAVLYRNPFVYYNHLWRGERQAFFWLGQIKSMDYNEKLDRYIGRFNHLSQAIDAFSKIKLDEADKETGAKTLFSLALSKSKLSEFGEEIKFYATKTELGKQLIAYCEQLVKQYPDSSLADDALMLAYHYSKQKSYLDRLLQAYPQGDQAARAKKLLAELAKLATQQNDPLNGSDPLYANVPIQTLDIRDWRVPDTIKQWVVEHRGTDFQGVKQDAEWLYIYLGAKPGKKAYVMVDTDRNGTYLRYASYDRTANGNDTPDCFIRLPYRFIQPKKVVWQPM